MRGAEGGDDRLQNVDAHDAVVAALRRAHPYEEPAFDVVALVEP